MVEEERLVSELSTPGPNWPEKPSTRHLWGDEEDWSLLCTSAALGCDVGGAKRLAGMCTVHTGLALPCRTAAHFSCWRCTTVLCKPEIPLACVQSPTSWEATHQVSQPLSGATDTYRLLEPAEESVRVHRQTEPPR